MHFAKEDLPEDCRGIIREFLPVHVHERCCACGLPVVMGDRRGRVHYRRDMACTEGTILCSACFENGAHHFGA